MLRLHEFATGRQENIEKELLFNQKLEDAKAFFDAGRFEDAMRAVQNALKTFPGNAELQSLYEQAEIQQRKLQVRQQIEHRIREIRFKINREELSEAVDLAKQTLMTLGPDTDLTQLLDSAEVELHAREKKRLQEGTLDTIRTLINAGQLDLASQTIDEVIESQTLDSFDPRIERLSARIREAKTAPTEPAPTHGLSQRVCVPAGPATSRCSAFTGKGSPSGFCSGYDAVSGKHHRAASAQQTKRSSACRSQGTGTTRNSNFPGRDKTAEYSACGVRRPDQRTTASVVTRRLAGCHKRKHPQCYLGPHRCGASPRSWQFWRS